MKIFASQKGISIDQFIAKLDGLTLLTAGGRTDLKQLQSDLAAFREDQQRMNKLLLEKLESQFKAVCDSHGEMNRSIDEGFEAVLAQQRGTHDGVCNELADTNKALAGLGDANQQLVEWAMTINGKIDIAMPPRKQRKPAGTWSSKRDKATGEILATFTPKRRRPARKAGR